MGIRGQVVRKLTEQLGQTQEPAEQTILASTNNDSNDAAGPDASESSVQRQEAEGRPPHNVSPPQDRALPTTTRTEDKHAEQRVRTFRSQHSTGHSPYSELRRT